MNRGAPAAVNAVPFDRWREGWRIFARNRLSVAGAGFLLLLAAAALLAALLSPFDPAMVGVGPSLVAPGAAHWLGTDELGRDVFSRVLHGLRVSLFVGFATALLASGVGIFVGAIAGFSAYAYALKHLPVATVSLYAYVNPIIAVALGTVVLSEPFSARMVLAAIVVFAGIALVRVT